MSNADRLPKNCLYRRRRAAGIRQKEMAKRLGVSHQTLYAWERGRVIPRVDKLALIAKELGCTVEELIREFCEEETAGGASVCDTSSVAYGDTFPSRGRQENAVETTGGASVCDTSSVACGDTFPSRGRQENAAETAGDDAETAGGASSSPTDEMIPQRRR